MKLASFQLIDGSVQREVSERVGVVLDGGVLDVTDLVHSLPSGAPALGACMSQLLGAWQELRPRIEEAAMRRAQKPLLGLEQVRLLAPVPKPGKIIAVGRNYADHVKESGGAITESPRLVFKMPNSVVGPGAVVTIPQGIRKLDFEVELAVVVGTRARNLSAETALSAVGGYSILNDLSARELQFDVSPPQSTFSKSMDGFCPFGPWIVTADAIPDPQVLRLRTWLNKELMQDGNSSDMIHAVRDVVAYASRFMTLEPGDVIATGTPAGVGLGRTPPVWLRPGDALRFEISGIGALEHSIG
jgi:2-keto-4-pentenoate hydratase/2-oxohepta-3-ene-1,7-dioic acid hydratase in catechol pathway